MNIESSNVYDKDYLLWKRWGGKKSFGQLSKAQEKYFSSELEKLNLHSIENVMEIGFGNGSFLSYCKTNSWKVLGTEMNPGLIEMAQKSGFQAVLADQISNTQEATFDLVVAFDVLEHINQADIIQMLTHIRRVLRPGGCFLARFPNGDSPLGLQLQNGDITHLTTLGSGKIEYFSKILDFDLISLGGAAQPLTGGGLITLLRRALIVPTKYILECIYRNIFFPGTRVAYFSPSLVICFRKPFRDSEVPKFFRQYD